MLLAGGFLARHADRRGDQPGRQLVEIGDDLGGKAHRRQPLEIARRQAARERRQRAVPRKQLRVDAAAAITILGHQRIDPRDDALQRFGLPRKAGRQSVDRAHQIDDGVGIADLPDRRARPIVLRPARQHRIEPGGGGGGWRGRCGGGRGRGSGWGRGRRRGLSKRRDRHGQQQRKRGDSADRHHRTRERKRGRRVNRGVGGVRMRWMVYQ